MRAKAHIRPLKCYNQVRWEKKLTYNQQKCYNCPMRENVHKNYQNSIIWHNRNMEKSESEAHSGIIREYDAKDAQGVYDLFCAVEEYDYLGVNAATLTVEELKEKLTPPEVMQRCVGIIDHEIVSYEAVINPTMQATKWWPYFGDEITKIAVMDQLIVHPQWRHRGVGTLTTRYHRQMIWEAGGIPACVIAQHQINALNLVKKESGTWCATQREPQTGIIYKAYWLHPVPGKMTLHKGGAPY